MTGESSRAERYPALVQAMQQGDHEIGHHGYLHEYYRQQWQGNNGL